MMRKQSQERLTDGPVVLILPLPEKGFSSLSFFFLNHKCFVRPAHVNAGC